MAVKPQDVCEFFEPNQPRKQQHGIKSLNYKTLCCESPITLDKRVEDLLAEGWELYGSPYAVHDQASLEGTISGFCCQALIRSKVSK